MPVAVELEGVVKTFGVTRAVDRVTLSIEPGELFFLLGPSGCGKTTLLRCIAGFAIPDAGRISIGGQDVTRMPPYRRDTGMVFQSYALWPHMSVAQNVAFGLEMRHCTRAEIAQRVADALDRVEMSDRAEAKPNQLSGGQQQRVALARALVIHPRCLLLDEPLSNLDAKLRLAMRFEIRRICKAAGLTAIYVTHDQKEALSIADRLAVLRDGIVEQTGTPREVYDCPESIFTAGFIGETNFVPGISQGRHGGLLRVKTALGDFVSAGKDALYTAEGSPVMLSLRPERLHLGDSAADTPNRLTGLVHDSVYLGELAQHQVRVGGATGQDFKVVDLNPRIIARDSQTQATVWIEPEHVVVLPAAGATP